MSLELTRVLKDLQLDRELEAVTRQWGEKASWVFDPAGLFSITILYEKAFHHLLKAAGFAGCGSMTSVIPSPHFYCSKGRVRFT